MNDTGLRSLGERERRALLPYVARLHAEWFQQSPDQMHRRVPGTLVFADISGFTALTERLARKGKVGAEEMSDALNAVFSDILQPAEEEGGDLVKWGGDAVLLLFAGDDHAVRASRAAYLMRARLRDFGKLNTTAGSVRLRMSQGVHSGDFDFYLVGDRERHLELLVSGPEVSQCVRLESNANAGEIAISHRTLSQIGEMYAGKPVEDEGFLLKGCPDPTATIPSRLHVEIPDLRPLLPSQIRAHLLRGVTDPEHRDIAVAFVKFTGTDRLATEEGPAAVAEALDHVIRNVSSAADEFGVTFFETDLDADGGKVMLAAGVPTSGGHHAERMLRATRLMLDRSGRLPLKIGVNYGHVFSGDFGPSFRRTYSIKGDPINLAARVMGKSSPGKLFATRTVVERSETRFDTVQLEPFAVKGKSQLVHALEVGPVVDAPRDRRSHVNPIVGRDAELETIRSLLDEVGGGKGRALDIAGPPGIGKSRLVEEAVRMAGQRTVYVVQCVEYDASTPYHLFWVLLHNILKLKVGMPPEDAELALREQVARVAPDLLPWLPLIATPLGYALPETEVTRGLEEKFRVAKIEEVVVDFLGRTLPAGALLAFDDVQFLDSASVGILHRLVDRITAYPIALVLGRSGIDDGWVPASGAEVTSIRLEPLSADDALRMVQAANAEHPLPPKVAQALAAKAGGNPLFLESLVQAVGPTGDVENLPDSVSDLLITQIDQLAPRARTLLRRASVLGAGFDLAQLPLLLEDQSDVELLDDLDEFLHVEHDRRWATFRHAMVRDVAYEGLPYRQRQRLHARIGEALEREGSIVGSRPELLSLHFFHAHRLDKAWDYSRQAGELAKSKFANAEAADQFVRAVDAARRLPAAQVPRQALGQTYEALADCWFTIGLVDPSTKAFREAYELLRADRVEAARVAGKQAKIEQRLRKLPQSLARISRELKHLGTSRDPRLASARSLLLTRYAAGKLNQGRFDAAIEYGLRAIEEGKVAADPDCLAQAYSAVHVTYLTAGRPMDEPYGELAYAAFVEAGDLVGQAHCTNNLAFEAFTEQRWTDAAEMFQRAASTFNVLGDTANEGNAMCNHGEVLVSQGRYLEALPLLDEALIDARSTSDDELVALTLRQQARAYLRGGNVERGLVVLEESRAMFEAIDEPEELPAVDVLRAEAFLYDGDAEEALALAGVLLAGEAGAEFEPTLRWIRGFAKLDLRDVDGALEDFEIGRAASERDEDPYADALNRLGLASAAHLSEQREAAEKILDKLGVVSLPRGLGVPVT